jgi:short-subunit dehydrogenase
MAARKKGHIVLVGSVAAAFPLPMAPLYSGSKAGLEMFAQALSLRLRRHGVAVTLVAPGFIDTPMSQSLNEPRPFLISADQAAAIIARRLAKGRRHIVLPWQFSMILGLSKLVPRAVVRAILSVF